MSNNMFYCSFVSIHYIICECGDTFPTEEALKEHLENDHKKAIERNEYKCATCERIFTSEKACLIHQRIHVPNYSRQRRSKEGEESKDRKSKACYRFKNIICEVCGKRYASNAALRYHQRVHTGERPYQCTMCPKNFTMPLFLQIHLRTHTGERPYECPLCPKAFSNKAALLRHDRVHSGAKPYQCPKCGKFFTQSNSMKLHVKTVHLKMPAPYKSKNRRNKQAMKQAAMNIQVDIEEAIYKPQTKQSAQQPVEKEIVYEMDGKDVIYETEEKEIVYEPDGKEIVYEIRKDGQNDVQVKEEVREYEEEEITDVYHEVYEDGEYLYEEVKVEDAEVALYEDGEDTEVLYEEVYTFEEV